MGGVFRRRKTHGISYEPLAAHFWRGRTVFHIARGVEDIHGLPQNSESPVLVKKKNPASAGFLLPHGFVYVAVNPDLGMVFLINSRISPTRVKHLEKMRAVAAEWSL